MTFTVVDHLMTPVNYLTQSLWRDEAFSYVLAKNSVFNIILLGKGDFNPPLYYIILHFWMRLFGDTEIAMRSLSFVFHLLTCYVVYKFISKVINSRVGFFAMILTFFNPMLLYFSFEARMYSMLACLSVTSVYFYYFKSWKWWFLISLAGIYTHLFFWFVILVQLINAGKSYLKNFIILILFFIPWVPVVLTQIIKGSKDFWVNKIDLQLVRSAIGNIFTSYEGTPSGHWEKTALVSLVMMITLLLIVKRKRDGFTKLLVIWLFAPLAIIILISLWKPLFVNRYLIFLVFPMVFILVRIIEISRKRFLIFLIFLLFEMSVFLYLGPYYKKIDIRETVRQASMQMSRGDVLVSKTPLTFFEVNYYSGFKSYLWAVDKNLIPAYVGKVLINEGKILPNFESVKGRVYLINDDGSITVW